MIGVIFLIFAGILNATQTLTIWAMGYEGMKINLMVKEFEKQNPQIKVKVQAIPWEAAHEKILTSVIGDIPPDLCQMGTTWMSEFIAMEAVYPLDSFIKKSQFVNENLFFKGSLSTCKYKNKTYGIPWYVDTRVLFYRKDILKTCGFPEPPKNWDEFLKAGKNIVEKFSKSKEKHYGISLPVKDWQAFMPFLWQNNGDPLNPASPEAIETFTYYKKFFDEKISPKGGAGIDLLQGFKKGIFAMFISGPWMVEQLKTNTPEISGKWSVAPLPCGKKSASFVGGCNWVIFKKSKNKETAWKFIEFMTRVKNQIKWYGITKDLPSNKNAWKDKILQDEKIKVFGIQLNTALAPPNIPEWEKIAHTYEETLEEVIMGVKTPQQAGEKLAKKIKNILSAKQKKKGLMPLIIIAIIIVVVFLLVLKKPSKEADFNVPFFKNAFIPYLFILPAVGLLFIFLFIPVLLSFLISFTNWNIYTFSNLSKLSFTGLENYIALFKDKVFWKALFNTIIFAGIGVPINIIIALFTAVLLNENFLKGRSFFRASFFMPVITTLVAVAVIWRWIYNPDYGLLNYVLSQFSIPTQDWLGNTKYALPSLIFMSIWKNFGYNMVIFLAGLQTIPKSLYEASSIDGANKWHQFLYITLPSLKPTMFFVSIMSTIGYLQFFAEPYIMTKGGPLNSTLSVVYYLYQNGFKFYNLGYATSIAYILFVFIFVLTLVQMKLKKVMEE